MILKSLQIARKDDWLDKSDGPLVGVVRFSGKHGEVSINLSEAAAKRILAVVADGIVEASQEVAKELTADVLNQTAPALEHRK